jgi:hypothetical protein
MLLAGMTDWQLVFGDSLPNAVREILLRAMEKHTVEGYNDAIQQLHGIDYLLLCMGFRDDAIIRMQNEIRKLELLKEALG